MKKISIPDIQWFLILLCYACSILFLILSNKLYDFLHPRMFIFAIIAVIILFIISGYQCLKIFKSDIKNRSFQKGFLIFIIPLFLGFAARNIDTSSALAQAQGNGDGQIVELDAVSKKYTDVDIKELLKRPVIKVDDKEYYKIQFILYENAELFSGKEIDIIGFLYRDDDFTQPDIFLLARYIMWCCAADAVLSGYVCDYPDTDKLHMDTWVRVSGTLGISSYVDNNGKNVTIPKIIVKKITAIDPPAKKYIFAR
ncbi:MAG: TIGR03943 family protein [Spirochaetales bacterium]|nr:TIGR03943 family protein [Spirochaetales bacterium]